MPATNQHNQHDQHAEPGGSSEPVMNDEPITPLAKHESTSDVTKLEPWAMDDTASLSESVQTFPEEFGRTYHAYRAGSYAFPNDAPEQERLALQGQAVKKLLCDRLYLAPLLPLEPPRWVLDIATGVGDWAIEMGDLFPASTVIATDLSPIQPKEVPPNVHFYVDDATDTWEFAQKFDYIHTRSTAGCWASFETQIAEKAFAALEPGGLFESQEMDCNVCCDDGTLDPEGPVVTWFKDLQVASDLMNRPAIIGVTLKEVFQRVGFVDVRERRVKMPIGGWAEEKRLREAGLMWEANLRDGLGAFSYQLFSKALGRTHAEIEVSMVEVRQRLGDPRTHAYMPGYVVWGRKPYPEEASAALTPETPTDGRAQ
ncbi:hypothetical protein NM208_g3142 [Fusarium decemcellulare]|uniref:Uncharacterized protein n=1 Tax=Fusarium decemcellulare TaxID=57161 RepID=A0ACC1SQH8_9HYPO|nr:hypothetical protein NM208_g3142 [Fusarium decemcellulare]